MARSTEILAVVVDPVDKNAEVVADLGLSFRVLADPELKAIDAYGLRHREGFEGHDIARPATFLLDAEGRILWRSLAESYRIRPRPDDILVQIDASKP